MKRNNNNNNREVALKLDVSKAYDRVDCGYLKMQMKKMDFSNKWIGSIMLCVSKVSYSVCFNGDQVGPIVPKRGLRQGDPLSPYLFLFCVEGLSISLKEATDAQRIRGCKICVNASAVTHLLFADDSFLYYNTTTEEILEIKSILARYEELPGQAINLQKSGIYFSANVRRDKQ